MPEFIRVMCLVPNKNVIQGMDLVYSQTKSGRPDINYWKTKCPSVFYEFVVYVTEQCRNLRMLPYSVFTAVLFQESPRRFGRTRFGLM